MLADQLAAYSLIPIQHDEARGRRLLSDVTQAGVKNRDWLHERVLSAAGLTDHERLGDLLHGVPAGALRPKLFEFSRGQRRRWDW
jgi:hypothetical protein